MARTSNVFARIEPDLKEKADVILAQLGISMSNAVEMFLRQVVLQNGLPFEVKLPKNPPIYENLTAEQFNEEIQKGYDDIRSGRTISASDFAVEMAKDYGV